MDVDAPDEDEDEDTPSMNLNKQQLASVIAIAQQKIAPPILQPASSDVIMETEAKIPAKADDPEVKLENEEAEYTSRRQPLMELYNYLRMYCALLQGIRPVLSVHADGNPVCSITSIVKISPMES